MRDPLEHKVSITQDTQSSRERMEGTDLTRFVFNQTRGGLRLTSWPKVVPSVNEKKSVTYVGLASRRGDDGGGGGGGGGRGGT